MREDKSRPLQQPIQQQGVTLTGIIVGMTISVAVLYIVLIWTSFKITAISEKLTDVNELNLTCTDIGDLFRSGTDVLTEKARLFASTGDTVYLTDYFNELNNVQQREQALSLLDSLSDNSVSGQYIYNAMNDAKKLKDKELHSMKLACLAYDIQEFALSEELTEYDIPVDERNYSKDEMISVACQLVMDSEYQGRKDMVSNSIDQFNEDVQSKISDEYGNLSTVLEKSMTTQKTVISILFVLLFSEIAIVFVDIIIPLRKSAENIRRGQYLYNSFKLPELENLGYMYNSLLKNKELKENDLISSAKTDTLTSMSNRYAMNLFIEEKIKNYPDKSLVIFNFDVNGLKKTNDTKGHEYGDKLIKNAADCIKECFGDELGKNCFRTGGDEFIALCQDIHEEDIPGMLDRFVINQKERGVSIAYGYAYIGDTRDADINELFKKADSSMYRKKAEIKGIDSNKKENDLNISKTEQ